MATATVRTNARAGTCHRPACRQSVPAGVGVLDKQNGNWVVWCRGCYPAQIAPPAPVVRELNERGEIRTPYEPENLNVIRSFPGAKWNAAGKFWTVSTAPVDRPRVLELAARMGLSAAESLRNAPPVPVAAHGTVPTGRTLFGFQNAGIEFLASRERALLGDDMGTGKTVQTLIALPPAETCRAVVICPACVKFNWRDETARWRPDLTPVALAGRGCLRIPAPGEVLIVNYDVLPAEPPAGWDAAGITLVADEAHMTKNYKAQRSVKVKKLSSASARTWFLTGTPLLNRPFDLYGVLQACGLDRAVFGGFGGFLRAFNGCKDRWGGFTFGGPEPYVAEKMRNVMLRRRKDEVLTDLPPKVYQDVPVNGLSAGLRRRMDAAWDDEDISVRGADDALPPFEMFSAIRADLAREKIPALLELIEPYEDAETPVVAFSAHRDPVLELGTRPGWAAITGDVGPEERNQIVARFQNGELKGLALTIAAGGVGITLTRASTVLFADLDWTPALNCQAEDRLHRIGQTGQSVQVIRLVAEHPLEQHVHTLLVAKMAMIGAAIDGAPVAGFVPAPVTVEPGESPEAFAARTAANADADRKYAEGSSERAAADARNRAKSRVTGFLARERGRAEREPKPMAPELAETVRAAFAGMLAVCDGAESRDGAGWNKPDAFVAHVVLTAGLDGPDELETAYRMLLRYPRQNRGNYPELF